MRDRMCKPGPVASSGYDVDCSWETGRVGAVATAVWATGRYLGEIALRPARTYLPPRAYLAAASGQIDKLNFKTVTQHS